MISLWELLEQIDEIHPTPPVKMVDPNGPEYDEEDNDEKKVPKSTSVPFEV